MERDYIMDDGPILIVDDNPASLELSQRVLLARGFEVQTARDGERALALLETVRPRLIVMDLQLPGIDGVELTRRLKANAATRNITVLAVTAYAMKGDEQRAREAGCDAYLTKPVDIHTLAATVTGLLAR